MSGTKGLNTTDSVNRVRFANLSQRLSRVNVDVVHRTRAQGSLDLHHSAVPTTGPLGCHFQDELELCKTLDTASHFKRFYYAIWPLVQSLPELLHHQKEVVTMIESYVQKGQPATLSSFLQLISVLGRDLQEDLYPHYHQLFGMLVKQVDTVAYSGNSKSGASNAPNPELTGKLFETLSYLIKYQLHRLADEASSMRKYYGPLLGHTAGFVREYSAKAFSLLMKKLKSKIFKAQSKQLLKAVAANCKSNCSASNGSISLLAYTGFEGCRETAVGIQPSKRIQDLLDGLAQLFYNTCKGVKGCLHSKGGEKISMVLDLLLPFSSSSSSSSSSSALKDMQSDTTPVEKYAKKQSNKGKNNEAEAKAKLQLEVGRAAMKSVTSEDTWVTYALTQVLTNCLTKLFRHVHPSNMAELWVRLISAGQAVLTGCTLLDSLEEASEHVCALLECAAMFIVEFLLFGLGHSKGRGLSNAEVRGSVEKQLINVSLGLCEIGLRNNNSSSSDREDLTVWRSARLTERLRLLLCRLWIHFPRNLTLLNRVSTVLAGAIPAVWPTPAAPLLASELFPALPVDISRKYLVLPMLSAIVAMIKNTSSSSKVLSIKSAEAEAEGEGEEEGVAPVEDAVSKERNLWLSVLLEILIKLCDIRDNDTCLEPEINFAAAAEQSYKKKGNGLRRLKGPDVGTEEWGNLSDDLGNGSGSGSDEDVYSSSDESLPEVAAIKEGEELPSGGNKGSKKVFGVIGGSQLTTLLSSCSAELAVIAGALLDILSVPLQTPHTSSSSKSDDVSVIMACSCVRWLVVAFPSPLLGAADTPGQGQMTPKKGKKTAGADTSNRVKFSAVLCDVTTAMTSPVQSLMSPQSKAHHTQLLVSVINQPDLSPLGDSLVLCRNVIPDLVRRYISVFVSDPYSIANVWAILGLLKHLSAERDRVEGDDMLLNDEDRESVLIALLSTQELSSVLEALGTALQTPSYWLRVCLLKLMCYLPHPYLSAVEGGKTDGSEARTVNIAQLCLEAACTPAELKAEREFSRRTGKLEIHIRSGRLPAPYVRIVCSMCLGLLNVKFKPFWEPSVLLLIAAAGSKEGEAELWPLLLEFIQTSSKKTDAGTQLNRKKIKPTLDEDGDEIEPISTKTATLTASDDVTLLSSRPIDSGEEAVSTELAECKMFYYLVDPTAAGRVEPDSRADAETVFGNAWDVLRRCPNITLVRSRTVVPMFLRFLRWHYYVAFKEDPELPFLISIGLFSTPDSDRLPVSSLKTSEIKAVTASKTTKAIKSGKLNKNNIENEKENGSDKAEQGKEEQKEEEISVLHPSVLKKRLEMFLKVFAAVISPKQLYLHQQLFDFYTSILARSETNIVKVAYDCILGYKPPYLMPVRENVRRLLDDKKIRDELVVFDPSVGGDGVRSSRSSAAVDEGQLGVIDPTHRKELVPLIVRIVYGRFVSKAKGSQQAREQNLARRSAILSFLSRLPPDETCHLTHLMLRGVVPQDALLAAATALSNDPSDACKHPQHRSFIDRSNAWYAAVSTIAQSMTAREISHVAWERQIGFLHLLEQTVRLVGFGISAQVEVLVKVLLAMLSGSQAGAWKRKHFGGESTDMEVDVDVYVDVEVEDKEGEVGEGDDLNEDAIEVLKEGGEGEGQETSLTSTHYRDANQSSKVRSLSLLRLSEIVHQYHGTFEFVSMRSELLSPLTGLITALPGAVTGSSRPPGLLRLLSAFVRYDETVAVIVPPLPAVAPIPTTALTSATATVAVSVAKGKGKKSKAAPDSEATPSSNGSAIVTATVSPVEDGTDLIVQTLIRCVAARADFEVSRMVMDVLSVLLEREDGRAIMPHAHLIIQCFSKRFVGPDFDDSPGVSAQLKLSEMKITPTGSVKQELKLLCRIAERVFSRSDIAIDSVSICNLATLLLGMLRTYTTSRKIRVEEEWVLDILRIYGSLLWRMEDVTPHIAFIGRLFGPAGHSLSLFNLSTVRAELAVVYTAMSKHPSSGVTPSLRLNALTIAALIAVDRKLIDSRDFAECMPVFQALGGEVKDRIALLSATASTGADTDADAMPVNKAGKLKRFRIEITEPNLIKSRKTASNPSAGAGTGNTEGEVDINEIVLDPETLTWSALLGPQGCSSPRQATLCMVAVHECLRCMYDSELVIRAGALSALKRLCLEAGVWSGVRASKSLNDDGESSDGSYLVPVSDGSVKWMEVLTSVVVPGVRRGLKQSTDLVKKGFVSLLASIVLSLGRPAHAVLSSLPSLPLSSSSPSSSTPPLTLTPSSTLTHPVWTQLAETFHSDLFFLLHEDPEQDFFENINHIQLHRRVRAFTKLRAILKATAVASNSLAFADTSTDNNSNSSSSSSSSNGASLLMIANSASSSSSSSSTAEATAGTEGTAGTASPVDPDLSISPSSLSSLIGIASISHVLLPLALHPLVSEEFKRKDHLTLLQESSAFVGAVGLHLPWTQYFALIKTILKQLDRQKAEKEKVLLTALCSILDSFHFEFEGDEEADGMEVPALSLSRKVMKPKNKKMTVEEKLEGRMIMEEGDKEGGSLVLRKAKLDAEGNDVMDEEAFEEEEEIKEMVKKVSEDDEKEEEAAVAEEENEGIIGDDNDTSKNTPVVNRSHTIARAVVNSIMPWVKVFLLKEEKDHKGNKSKTVRPMVALALTKLISRLHAPVVSDEKKSTLFSSLVIRVVDTLRSRDSQARDAARDSLAKMVQTMGLSSLNTVIYELQHSLTEGYQRHVCNYTIRYLLTTVLEAYVPPAAPSFQVIDTDTTADADTLKHKYNGEDKEEGKDSNGAGADADAEFTKHLEEMPSPEFDQCIPMIIMSVLDDLNGDSQEDREADAAKAAIREAKGNKANDTLEICARCILFRPTYALKHLEDPSAVSSVHALVTPLLTGLRNSNSSSNAIAATDSMGGRSALIGRIGEALQRVALGLSRNPSVTAPELLLYLHATLKPFVVTAIRDKEAQKRSKGMLDRPRIVKEGNEAEEEEDEGEDDEDEELPSYLREQSSDEEHAALYSKNKLNANGKKAKDRKNDVTGFRANTWLPSEARSVNTQRAAVEQRDSDRAQRDAVLDGSRAPKLTGRNRQMKGKSAGAGGSEGGGTDPAAVAAVRFCLSLFSACLKRNRMDPTDRVVLSMSAPFVPLLGQCLRLSGAVDVVTIATRCLCTLLTWGIQVEPKFVQAVGGRLLRLMLRSGALRSTDSELVQACIKGLTSLFALHNNRLAVRADTRMQMKERQAMREINDMMPDDIITEASKDDTGSTGGPSSKEQKAPVIMTVMPLSETNIRSLLGLLTASIMEVASNFQNVAFQLVRSIVDAKIIVPEVYDLITKLSEQIALSQRRGVRESAASVVVTFITTYPLGAKRVTAHMKQMISNCSYVYEDGRQSSFEALATLVRLLPLPLLEDHAASVFLPMTLRLVNDPSPVCREAAADVIASLARRVSPDTVNTLIQYSMRWLSGSSSSGSEGSGDMDASARAIVRTGSQVAGLMVSTRPDLFKKLGFVLQSVASVRAVLITLLRVMKGGVEGGMKRGSLEKREISKEDEGKGDGGGAEAWAVSYHLLVLIEKLYTNLPGATDHAVCHPLAAQDALQHALLTPSTADTEHDMAVDTDSTVAVLEGSGMVLFMEAVQEAMLFPHAWVRSASCRVLNLYLSRRDVIPARLKTSPDGLEVLTQPNGLYHLARRLCIVLNQPKLNDVLLQNAVTATVFVIRAMSRNPELSVMPERSEKDKGDAIQEEEEDEDDDEEGDDDEEEDVEDEEENDDDIGEAAVAAPVPVQSLPAYAPIKPKKGDKSDGKTSSSHTPSSSSSVLKGRESTGRSAVKGKSTIDNEHTVEGGEEGEGEEEAVDGCRWVMQRLKGLGSDPRGHKRLHVIRVFLALTAVEKKPFLLAHISQMMEVALRVRLHGGIHSDGVQGMDGSVSQSEEASIKESKAAATELLEALEAKVGSSAVLGRYADIQRMLQASKAEKKRALASEAVKDPKAYAVRKMEKTQKKKESRKRKSLKHASVKGKKRKGAAGCAILQETE